jgi:Ser/Thr protein kinase RdoA (MazF antagonist)
MEPAVRALHTEALREVIAQAVGVPVGGLGLLGGFESFVYEASVNGVPRIVKATWHERRTPAQIGAEAHFVNYLADGGAPVCRALPLASGRVVETVAAASGAFHVCAFEKAAGAVLTREERTDAHWIRWGALVGQMHRLSAAYPGPPPPLGRPTWEEEYTAFGPFLDGEPEIRRAFDRTLDALRALPREAGAYGPIHTDLHSHNLFWTGLEPRVFDFDDMLDFWFISDLAIVLYYGLMNPIWHEGDRQADFERLRGLLWEGYATEHALPDWSYEALPHFLALREQTLVAVTIRSVPEEQRNERWQAYFLEASARLREGRPALDLRV